MQYQPVCTFTMYFSRFVLQVQQRIGYCPQVGMYVTGKGKGVEENTWKRYKNAKRRKTKDQQNHFLFYEYTLEPRLTDTPE